MRSDPPKPGETPPARHGPRSISDRAERLWGWGVAALNGAGSVWILALMLLILADVIGRGAFSAPVRGVPELVGISIVGIVFLQLAAAVAGDRLTRSDALLGQLHRRLPRLGALLEAAISLAGTAMFLVIAHVSWPLFLRSWQAGEYVGVAGYFMAPTWPIKLIMVVGCVLAALAFLQRALHHALRVLRPGPAP